MALCHLQISQAPTQPPTSPSGYTAGQGLSVVGAVQSSNPSLISAANRTVMLEFGEWVYCFAGYTCA